MLFMKYLAIAFTGPSNSGKTTLIKKVATKLIEQNYKVAIIKHDPKNKAVFDKEGKDSDIFFKTGANVAVVSPKKTVIFKHQSLNLKELANNLGKFDFLLVEGLKTWKLPRIGVFRGEIEDSYLDYLQAIAVDNSINKDDLKKINKQILDLNNTQEIIDYIFKNAIKIKE